jgi:hypothetical protein
MACTANSLLASAASNGYYGLDSLNLKMCILQLLCLTTTGASATLTGTGSPVGVVTPTFVGQLYTDQNGPPYGLWQSTGLTSADWSQLLGN